MSVNIIISCDNGSIENIDPLITSIINNVSDPVIYLILDEYQDVKHCNVIVRKNEWSCPIGRITGHSYHKLYLDEYFPEMDKCIWLDFDTLVVGDLKDLLSGDNWEIKAYGEKNEFFNSGVLAFNFNKKCKELLNECRKLNTGELDDQKILNKIFKNVFIPLPQEYNFYAFLKRDIDPKIIHFIGDNKPWKMNKNYYSWIEYKVKGNLN